MNGNNVGEGDGWQIQTFEDYSGTKLSQVCRFLSISKFTRQTEMGQRADIEVSALLDSFCVMNNSCRATVFLIVNAKDY